MKVKYLCLRCQHRWEGKPGPVTCPKCGHYYVKWLNYEAMKKEWDEDETTRNATA